MIKYKATIVIFISLLQGCASPGSNTVSSLKPQKPMINQKVNKPVLVLEKASTYEKTSVQTFLIDLSREFQPQSTSQSWSLDTTNHLQSVQLPSGEIQTISDWQQQALQKILVEFGEREDFQVPISFQGQVAKWIAYFTEPDSKKRAWFSRALERMDAYYPTIDGIFSARQLPKALYYLALIESGFNPQARSHAGAVGLWQFIPSTARRYGLKVNSRIDQRIHPKQATYAAREYLLDLILEFGDGHSMLLAMAAYNAGENGIRKKLRRLDNYQLRRFWTLAKSGLLPAETHDYVPKILAATIIGRNRARFGFTTHAHKYAEY